MDILLIFNTLKGEFTMSEFSKNIEQYGSWNGGVNLSLNQDISKEMYKEAFEKDFISFDTVRGIMEKGEHTNEVVSASYLDDYCRDSIKNAILDGYSNGTINLKSGSIDWEVDIDCTLDGSDFRFDDLSEVSKEHVLNAILEDNCKWGELTEDINVDYEVEVSGITVCAYDENYLEGEICITDSNGEVETCSFEYNMESEELSFHKYSAPGWMTGASHETLLPDMIEDNLDEIHTTAMWEIEDFIDEMNQDKELPSLDDKLEAATVKQAEIPAIAPFRKLPAIGPARKSDDMEK